jgi:predicted permease
MRWLTELINRMRPIWSRRRIEEELRAELENHFEQEVEDGMRRGLTREEARLAAQRLIGQLELHKEGMRDARGITFLDTLMRDVRYAIRTFRKTPWFATAAVLTLALGIGANTTVFTFIEKVLFRGPDIQDPAHVRTLAWGNGVDMSYPNYLDFRDRNATFSGLAGDRFGPVNLSIEPGSNWRIWGYEVTGNYFDVLGVHPQLGRLIHASDDGQRGASSVVVISDRLWKTRFAADPDVIGRQVKLNGFRFTIIGVAPPQFGGTELIISADYWAPLSMFAQIEPGSRWPDVRVSQNLWALGRLKPGVTVRQAEADLDRIVAGIGRAYPNEVDRATQIHLAPSGLVGKAVRDPVASFSLVLLTIAGVGLLLACVNLAGMLLARASVRTKEIGIRLAIGASRGQLLRQLLTEALLLACCGGALGLALAASACRLISAVHFDFGVPFAVQLEPDARVAIFSLGLSIFTALAFGLIPALQTVGRRNVSGLRSGHSAGARNRWSLRDAVVSVQVAISLVLVIGSLLVVKSLNRAMDLNLGLKPEGAYAMTADLRAEGYDEARSRRFRHELLSRARNVPGIEAAGIINSLPLNLAGLESDYYMPVGAPIPSVEARRVSLVYNVTAGYFRAAGTRLLRGRDISEADQKGRPPVAVVNGAAAKALFPPGDALGNRFRLSLDPKDPGYEIVGIVETGKYRFLSDQEQPAVFLPIDQANTNLTTLVARSALPPGELATELRQIAMGIDPQITLFQAGTLTEQLALPLFPARVAAMALGTFGTLALVLSATGLFSLVAFAVARRAREIGIRIALGATSSEVLRTLLLRTAAACGTGLLVGLGIALAASRLLGAILYGVAPHDPAVYSIAVSLVIVIAGLACWNPARRALRLDPATVLREE